MSFSERSADVLESPTTGGNIEIASDALSDVTTAETTRGDRGSSKAEADPAGVPNSGLQQHHGVIPPVFGNHELRPITQESSGHDVRESINELDKSKRLLSLSPDSPANNAEFSSGKSLSRRERPGTYGLEESMEETYLDPTPRTPRQGTSPSRRPVAGDEVKGEEGSTSEIQNIMDQFDESDYAVQDEEGNVSARESRDSNLGAPIQHPPRRSSLEPLRSVEPSPAAEPTDPSRFPPYQIHYAKPNLEAPAPDSPSGAPPMRTSSLPQSVQLQADESMASSSHNSSMSLPRKPPPDPDPEPDLQFDFHRFLEQLRHRTADPVAKFLRSFLIEFGKKNWMAHEQVKIINDFLTFITNKMAQCEVWRGVSDAEFDNAKEGMEKLVMNRLYSQTFSPAIPAPAPVQGPKSKRKEVGKMLGSGRRGQHQEDVERDEILGQKVRIYGWVREEHLDILPVGDSGRRFLLLAQQELLKIKTYRAPRDKIICVLNCCKVIFGLLRNSKHSDTSADSFVPLLIYVVLHANPEHLVSNVQYILRFRNQDKLGGEAGYYLSSLMGAIQFIENLDRTSLTVSDDDFEKNVEAAVSVIAERDKEAMPSSTPITTTAPPRNPTHPQFSEKSGLSQPEVTPRNSIEAEYSTPRRFTSSRDSSVPLLGSDGSDDGTAVGGLLRTIQKPLSSIGRMFSEDPPNALQRKHSGPYPPPSPPLRLSPAIFQPLQHSNETSRSVEEPRSVRDQNSIQDRKLSAEDAAARQASAEAAEAQRIQRAEHQTVVETLAGMFPDLDKDVIDDVVRQKQGRVGLAVDACLALNS